MLRNRSRVVTKQTTPTMMQDHQISSNSSSSPKPTQNPTRSILQRIISPTSILDTHRHSTSFGGNPFQFTKNPEKPLNSFDQNKPKVKNLDPEGIAVILVQEDKNSNVFNKPNAKKLMVQIPSDPFSLNGSPKGDFGIRTRNLFNCTDDLTPVGVRSPGYVTGPLSIKEMELSEEYTRVICHGPNPKTTHIYDNCVVDSCCGVRVGSPPPLVPLESGLSVCQTCKKKIGDGCDIFMYRGEKAFCSEECRCQEMILDGLMST